MLVATLVVAAIVWREWNRDKAAKLNGGAGPDIGSQDGGRLPTAGAFGFFSLTQCAERPERYGEPSRFETIPYSQAGSASGRLSGHPPRTAGA
jgi:hypothetical protein